MEKLERRIKSIVQQKMPVKLKGKMYKTVAIPAMMYGMEAVFVKKINERRMEVAEMRMLRWMCGVTKEDRIAMQGSEEQ